MDENMSKRFNPYHQWLGIPKAVKYPTYYQLVGISPTEKDEDVIRAILLRQRNYIKGFLSGPHGGHARRLLNQLDQAEATFLNATLGREYDKKLKIYEDRRKKNRPVKRKGGRGSSGTRIIHQDTGLTREMLGVMSVLIGGFLILATITYFLPWERIAATSNQEEPTTAISAEKAPAPKDNAVAVNPAESRDDLPAKTSKSVDTRQESNKSAQSKVDAERDFETKNLSPDKKAEMASDLVEPIIGDFRVRWTESNGKSGEVKYTFVKNGAVLKDGRDYGEWEKQEDDTYLISYRDKDRGTVAITFKGSDKFDGTHTWSKVERGRKTSRWAGTRF